MQKGYMTVPAGGGRRASKKQVSRSTRVVPPFPVQQMTILAMCRICEPIAFMSIFPYIYYMIEDFHITDDPSQISVYAGMVTSAFTLAEFSTSFLWGRLSDRIGRKPVLLLGMAGTGISVLIFGFAPNLQVALIARALGGLLNGNIGVLQTTVAELVREKEHRPRAFTVMPVVWCIGSVVGPVMGGALARPCISYPGVFSPGTIFERYPYMLPNLVSALTVFFGVIIGVLFLEETHAEVKKRGSWGAGVWQRFVSFMPFGKRQVEKADFTDYDELPGYTSVENSPTLSSIRGPELQDPLTLNAPAVKLVSKPYTGKVFTKPILLSIVSYGILAFHTMSMDQLLPVFLSTEPPPIREPYKLPFKFVDGFGLDTKTIGLILAVSGCYSIFSTFVLYPPFVKRIGALRLFRLTAVTYFVLYVVTPYVVLLPSSYRMAGVVILVIWKCTYATMAFPSNAMLTTELAPSESRLGTINGAAASTASFCRAIGPTISGILYSLGLQIGYSGLVWWVCAGTTVVGGVIACYIVEPRETVLDDESRPLLGAADDGDDDDASADARS